ncbi:MAG: methylated-DNA--[protein]-cysteine S-methyltransferase [Candidatus Omnitrophica bacterium]|nr:methylated-DNA--[protein]-cysteine S-methyltransferase [Candidatus Omnitrophota bacterium]
MPDPQRFKKAGGYPVIFWSVYKKKPKILCIVLSKNSKSFPGSAASSCPEINVIGDRIEKFLNGEDVHFPLNMLRLDLCPVFQRRVLTAAYDIARGRTSTYQLIAKQLGKPNAARAVGTALAANPFPLFIPCHRVIRSDGSPGGYLGGPKMKRVLLRKEGSYEKN